MESNEKKLEAELSEALQKGEFTQPEPKEAAKRELTPRYEVRIQTEFDPIVEETLKIRKMAKEIDDRYDQYLNRIPKNKK